MSQDGASCTDQEPDVATGTWYIIPCPSSVKLTSVKKERGTHGSIYTLWECELRSPLWVGQSIPALVRSINDKAVYSREKRLHASSLYRCLRGEAKKSAHKSWKVKKFSRTDLGQVNQHIEIFPSVVYVSKCPNMWRCGEPSFPQSPEEDLTEGTEDNTVPTEETEDDAVPGSPLVPGSTAASQQDSDAQEV
jgi:hypothetical protein